MTARTAPQLAELPPREDRLERMTPSAIRTVHNLAVELQRERPALDQIWLHFGESDLGTPRFIVDAGAQALRDGAVGYENNAGRADLTEALAEHMNGRMGLSLTPDHFVVTCGGVQAILLTMLGLIAPGDDVINITPAWPNVREAAVIAGGRVHELPLEFDAEAQAFRLDLAALERLGNRLGSLRLVVVNSPSNPTGYVASEAEQVALLAFCRRHGAVLMADEIYERLVYCEPPPRSFLQLAGEGDRLVVINGFSKTYAMTGWRLGYLVADPALAVRLAQMQEFVTSCAPAMAQVAAVSALRDGEAYVAESRERYRALRDLVLERLRSMPEVEVAQPDGAFYGFFRVPGSRDSLGFCRDFLRATGVALAPGVAFGTSGEGWLRLCYAKQPALLTEALQRFEGFVANGGQVGSECSSG